MEFEGGQKNQVGTLCLPNVSLQQVKDVVVKYLKDYPELRHHPAKTIVVAALQKAFPCPK